MEVRFPTDSTRGDFSSPSLHFSPSLDRSSLLINQLWNQGRTSVTSRDLNALCRRSEVPLWPLYWASWWTDVFDELCYPFFSDTCEIKIFGSRFWSFTRKSNVENKYKEKKPNRKEKKRKWAFPRGNFTSPSADVESPAKLEVDELSLGDIHQILVEVQGEVKQRKYFHINP